MKLRQRLMCLVLGAQMLLPACKAMETPPQRFDENKYVFVVIQKGALITAEEFQFATLRAKALCDRSDLRHMVSVEPDSLAKNGREMDVYHFSCEPRDLDALKVW